MERRGYEFSLDLFKPEFNLPDGSGEGVHQGGQFCVSCLNGGDLGVHGQYSRPLND